MQQNTILIIFGLTRMYIELAIYDTRGVYTDHYTTDTATFLLSVVSSITCTNKYSMSYTFKENENAVWCLGNAILASLGSSKCSHFYYQ